jgi:hypothetical protein
MLFVHSSLQLKRALPSIYLRRCLIHSTICKRQQTEEPKRPREYDLRVGFGKYDNKQCTLTYTYIYQV